MALTGLCPIWCNFQVAEVLAKVIKQEKEEENGNKGELNFL